MVLLFQVARQLYEPLVMQLIHWFTNNKKFESQDTVALLEAILVSVIPSCHSCWLAYVVSVQDLKLPIRVSECSISLDPSSFSFVLDNRWDTISWTWCHIYYLKWYFYFFFFFFFLKWYANIFLLCFGRMTINLTNFIYFEGLCVCLEGRKGEQECSWAFIRVAVPSCF